MLDSFLVRVFHPLGGTTPISDSAGDAIIMLQKTWSLMDFNGGRSLWLSWKQKKTF